MTISIDQITQALNRLCEHAATSGSDELRADADLLAVAAPAISSAIRASWALRHHGNWSPDDHYAGWWNVRVAVSDDIEADAIYVVSTIARPKNLW